jgi:pimeloyl-ACP methyl ester carboxylesterase
MVAETAEVHAMNIHTLLVNVCLALSFGHGGDDKRSSHGIEGYWVGTLADKVRLIVKVARDKDGAWTGDLDSPDEKLHGLPLSKVEFKDKMLAFELKLTKAVFEGKLNGKGTEIAGAWKQRGAELPLTFKRLSRPQEPKKPYPYVEEEVVFENVAAKVRLAGTLTVPAGKGPFPAVVLITGSGPQDRDETILHHKPFLVLADYLTRQGIAVLRYDDRGVAKSTGEFSKATTADFAEDTSAAVALLKSHKAIRADKIGLIGHSEGGVIAPMVAVKNPHVAFIVLLAGTGFTGEEIALQQIKLLHDALGMPEAKRTWTMKLQKAITTIIKEEKDDATLAKKVDAAVQVAFKQMPDLDKKDLAAVQQSIAQQLNPKGLTWVRFWFAHDPRAVLVKVKCPVLALNGAKDSQVIPENLKEIAKALKTGGNQDVTVKELAGLNHLFQTCRTGALSEYLEIEETFAPAVLDLIASWIKKRTER